jgi:sulfur-carrier protein
MPVVKLYATLRKLAEAKELSVSGGTVEALVSELVRQKPPIGKILLQDGELAPHIIVTVNGQNVVQLDTPVTEQDIVAIFPPIAGG